MVQLWATSKTTAHSRQQVALVPARSPHTADYSNKLIFGSKKTKIDVTHVIFIFLHSNIFLGFPTKNCKFCWKSIQGKKLQNKKKIRGRYHHKFCGKQREN